MEPRLGLRTYSFTLEGSPDHSTVADSEFSQAASRKNLALGDVERIHDGYNVVTTSAGTFDVL